MCEPLEALKRCYVTQLLHLSIVGSKILQECEEQAIQHVISADMWQELLLKAARLTKLIHEHNSLLQQKVGLLI
jgi:hypothetical protein